MNTEDAIANGRNIQASVRTKKKGNKQLTCAGLAALIRECSDRCQLITDVGLVQIDQKKKNPIHKAMLKKLMTEHPEDAREFVIDMIEHWDHVRRLIWVLSGKQPGYCVKLHVWYSWRKVIAIWRSKGKPDCLDLNDLAVRKGFKGSDEYNKQFKDYLAHIPMDRPRKNTGTRQAGDRINMGQSGSVGIQANRCATIRTL